MSADFMICSTEDIEWDGFYSYLLTAIQKYGVEEITANDYEKTAWLLQKEQNITFCFSLINKGDSTAFLIEQSSDELQIPFRTGIPVMIYSPGGLAKADRLAMSWSASISSAHGSQQRLGRNYAKRSSFFAGPAGGNKLSMLQCRPIGTQFMKNGAIALFELTAESAEIKLVREKYYRLVPPNEITEHKTWKPIAPIWI